MKECDYRDERQNENDEWCDVEDDQFYRRPNDVTKQLVLSHVGADQFARGRPVSSPGGVLSISTSEYDQK